MKFVRYQVGCAAAQLGIVNATEEQIYPLKAFGVDGETMEEIIGVMGAIHGNPCRGGDGI